VAERHLDATWEQALSRAGKDPKWAYLEADANNSAVPRAVIPAVIPFAGRTLTVEETLLLKATSPFDLQSVFKKHTGSHVILHIANDAIRLTTGTPQH